MKRIILALLLISFSFPSSSNADILSDVLSGIGLDVPSVGGSVDLSASIAYYALAQEKSLESQTKLIVGRSIVMTPMQEGLHRTAAIQQDFNDYLSAFHGVVIVAAQTYGFYHEIQHMITNYKDLENAIKAAPTNAFAVALKKDRSKVYGQIINDASGIVGDITKLCFGKDGKTVTKMTEKDRLLLVLGIRPKLKELNRHLRTLTRAIHYTNMADVWRDVKYDAIPNKPTEAIVKASFARWSAAAQGDKISNNNKK